YSQYIPRGHYERSDLLKAYFKSMMWYGRMTFRVNNEDETIEVAWNERLPEGVYRLEIELLGNDGDIIERRETIIESDLSAVSNVSQINDTDNGAVTPGENDEDGIPGFSSVAGIIGLILVSVFLRKTRR
ncbi:MAG: DUF3160 domain-containing protein, partial [Methanosarcina thermophila]